MSSHNENNKGEFQEEFSAEELFEKTEWTDRNKFDKTFEELFEVEVKMIDDGEETDSFFIHD